MNKLLGKTIYVKTDAEGVVSYLIFESDYNPCTFSNKCKNLSNTIINSENKEYYTVIGKIINFKYSIRYSYKKIGLFPATLDNKDVRLFFVLDTDKIFACKYMNCDKIKSDKVLNLTGNIFDFHYEDCYSNAKVTNFVLDKDINGNIICILDADINITVTKNINMLINKYVKFDNLYAMVALDNNDIWKMIKKYVGQAKLRSMHITKNYVEYIEKTLVKYKNNLYSIESSIEKCIL